MAVIVPSSRVSHLSHFAIGSRLRESAVFTGIGDLSRRWRQFVKGRPRLAGRKPSRYHNDAMEPRITQEPPVRSAAPADLEIKDAQLIFNQVWKQLESEYGRPQLRFPKELILLGGAPGAGKGTN